ncbi:molybdate ABC transporter substrate-binding protein [Bradyrhizobium retamae]|nr:molybdate ABC transporter substrate-binding protein [Bradyrhizobium retamae]
MVASIKRTPGHQAALSFGANGQCHSQIMQGASFQIFLSAEGARPKELVVDGIAVPESRLICNTGKLVLWKKPAVFVNGAEMSKSVAFAELSICNPATTLYDVVAVEAVSSPGVYETIHPKGVEGENITRADQYEAGYDELAFVDNEAASRWLMRQELDRPIRRGAAPLKSGADSKAAQGFIDFPKGPEAHAIIERYG